MAMDKPISGESLGQPALPTFEWWHLMNREAVMLTYRGDSWTCYMVTDFNDVYRRYTDVYIKYIYIFHDHPVYKHYNFSIVFPLIFQMISEQTAPFRLPFPPLRSCAGTAGATSIPKPRRDTYRSAPMCLGYPWGSGLGGGSKALVVDDYSLINYSIYMGF